MQASSLSSYSVIVCSTARLAHKLRLAQQSEHLASGKTQWLSQNIQTLPQWLASYTSYALLAGEVGAESVIPNTLNEFTEALLWQQAIASCIAKHDYADLFDVPSLASSAIAANKLLIDWQIADADVNQAFCSAETRQFLRWRNTFFNLCAQHQTVTPAWRMQQQVDMLAQADYPLPTQMCLVGFDRITPLEQRLLDILQSKGVQIEKRYLHVENPSLMQIGLADLNAECRAAVAWARAHLAKNPHCQLAIISPVQGHVRRALSDLLDDTFHAETIALSAGMANQYEVPRIYDFSVGIMLSETALSRTALNLLRMAATQQPIVQSDMSALLLDVYWGDLAELDARSLADARIRKKMLRSFSLQQCMDVLQAHAGLTQFNTHLQAIQSAQQTWPRRQLPSQWVDAFSALLHTLHWAQTRSLTSHEFQVKEAWESLLPCIAALDALTGQLSASDALYYLAQLARNKMFMPKAEREPRIQLLGMLENLSQPIDAIWVMGMNDHVWPPPANLNPLLPATLQRRLQTPGADPETQSAFAQVVHTRLCNSAREVMFSWSHQEGERELRVSPLMAGIAHLTVTEDAFATTLSETLAQPQTLQRLHDVQAPPLMPDEKLRGGSQLLAAQAICPAWAFYQYRLGAIALEEPGDGLDSMVRGNLVHAVLQNFWQDCVDLQQLQSLGAEVLARRIEAGIDVAIAGMPHAHTEQLMRIEKNRLQQLVLAWLQLEMQRDDFSVEACEAVYPITIAGMDIECRIDRIDALADDSLVIIDYKTGSSDPKTNSWTSPRIKEPQLPLYASIALSGHEVVAVCFAKVHVDGCKMSGLSQTDGLPGITPFEKLRSNAAFKAFENVPALIQHWRVSLENIADEIRQGRADVMFEDEDDLMYCGVKPLLRLPERQLQFEMQQTKQQEGEPHA